jgi:tetratricopeptide (TPR) repeat protein
MRRLVSLALVGALSIPMVAVAEGEQERARELNRRGMSKFELGEYDAALTLFKQAYELFSEPKIFFNLAQTYRKQRKYEMALDAYRAYLRHVPDAPNRKAVEERIAELVQLDAAQRASDDKPPEGVAPTTTTPPPPPAVIADPSPPPSRDVVTTADEGPRATGWSRDPLGWTLLGGGALVAGVGFGLYIHAQGQKDGIDDLAESMRGSRRDDIRRNQSIGITGVVVGSALVGAGIVRFVLVDRSASRRQLEVAFSGSGFSILGTL